MHRPLLRTLRSLLLALSVAVALSACSSAWENRDLDWLREIEGAVEELPEARGWLGVQVAPNESDSLEQIELRPGVRVRKVDPGSPADQSGIRPGDVLLAFDGTPVDDPQRLESILLGIDEARGVTLRMERGHRVFELDAELEVIEQAGKGRTLYHVERGLLRAAFSDTRSAGAYPVIARFMPDSPLPEAGFELGDRVLAFQGRDPGSAAELVRRVKLELAPGAHASMRVERGWNSGAGNRQELEIEFNAWDPGEVLVQSGLWPLWYWEQDRAQDREELSIGNLILISLYEQDRTGGETEYCILGLITWTTGEPQLQSRLYDDFDLDEEESP